MGDDVIIMLISNVYLKSIQPTKGYTLYQCTTTKGNKMNLVTMTLADFQGHRSGQPSKFMINNWPLFEQATIRSHYNFVPTCKIIKDILCLERS